jgi:galacturonosyltransferase
VKGLYRAGCDKAKVVFTENPGIQEELVSMNLFPAEKIHVLHGAGVNTEHYALAPYPAEETPVKFLFIGRVMKEKGIDEFFSAAKRLNADGIACEFHVAGDYEEDYDETIQQMQAKENLVYHGFLDDIRPLIASCHCFVLPSYHEGMANTLLECGAMGRPLITSAIHGCMEAVNENVSGWLVPTQDADSLYEAMKRFALLPRKKRIAWSPSPAD